MTLTERYHKIIEWFEKNVPIAETELQYDSPFHLLIAVILSAQCTDKRVNMTTPEIFERYPDAETLSKASFEELFPLVQSISYPNNKTKHLIGMAKMLTEEFGGQIPDDIDSLMRLPGVGRKTANVIASIVYDKPVIAVDTHVFRVSHRLGLSDGKTPDPVRAGWKGRGTGTVRRCGSGKYCQQRFVQREPAESDLCVYRNHFQNFPGIEDHSGSFPGRCCRLQIFVYTLE